MKPGLSRRLLSPLTPLYAGLVNIKGNLFDLGLLKQRKLAHPVISIGSLSAGGAGKTPVVIMLAELLSSADYDVRILTRGYGRRSKSIERVDPTGDPSRFGDEPLMMARRLTQASVWVGSDRYRAGVLSQQNDTAATKAIYLLDDGFQHRKLARDIDLVLLTRQDLEDSLLPAGNLREPLRALDRADIVLLRDNEAESLPAAITKPVWLIHRKLTLATNLAPRPLIFCGLARPQGFISMLKALGVTPAATVAFRDHHPYSSLDIEALLRAAHLHSANGFITTEKDAVKLDLSMMQQLESVGPVAAAHLEVQLPDEKLAIETLLTLLAAKKSASA